MTIEPIIATYIIETPNSIEQAAEMIAGEQSSGTFLAVPGETEDLKARHRAKVLAIRPLQPVRQASLPGYRLPSKANHETEFQRAEIQVAFPFENTGCNLPTLMATVCGNLYELSQLSGCKLIDLELPAEFSKRYAGPQFGVQGTRKLTGVFDRPLIGTIIKPSVGLSPEQTASMVKELGEAGIDFIKDDELMANPPHSPLARRVEAVMREVNRLADRLGRKVMVAFNITDEVDEMKRHHECVLRAGGTCVMVSVNHVGFAGFQALRRECQLPIHGHRNGWGMMNRHPALGIGFRAYQKLWRAAGVDHLHCNGLQNKFWEPDDSVVDSIQALRKPLWGGYEVMPVISSGQTGLQAPETLRRGGTIDLLYLAGGGIIAHPLGIAAGVRAIQQAWEAARAGISLPEFAQERTELQHSLNKFGAKD